MQVTAPCYLSELQSFLDVCFPRYNSLGRLKQCQFIRAILDMSSRKQVTPTFAKKRERNEKKKEAEKHTKCIHVKITFSLFYYNACNNMIGVERDVAVVCCIRGHSTQANPFREFAIGLHAQLLLVYFVC